MVLCELIVIYRLIDIPSVLFLRKCSILIALSFFILSQGDSRRNKTGSNKKKKKTVTETMNTVTERNKIGGAAKLSGFSLNRFHLLLCTYRYSSTSSSFNREEKSLFKKKKNFKLGGYFEAFSQYHYSSILLL
jgi:hypothetical protein